MVLLLCQFAVAQNKDVVILNDGSTYKGYIVSKNDDNVLLKVKGGDVRSFPTNTVDRLTTWKELPSEALKHSIGISLNSIAVNTLMIDYETPLPKVHKKFSVGGSLGVNFGNIIISSAAFPGIDISPMARWYIYGEANNYGFYAQLKVTVGYHKFGDSFDYDETYYALEKESFCSYGAGVSLGYMFKFSNPHWAIDVNVGYRYMNDRPKIVRIKNSAFGSNLDAAEDFLIGYLNVFDWKNILGPASPIDFKIGINYRF